MKLVNVMPPLALVVLALTWGSKPPVVVLVVVGIFLAASVLAAVHHAEVIAHRVGEPFGSLVLAVAVTVIEVGLIVTLMVGDSEGNATLARDTVFAAAMITCNGILGLCVLIAAIRGHVASFNAEGTATALATVATLAVLTLVLPTFTTSAPGRSSRPRSSRSRASRRSRCTGCSCSCRPSATATTSCRRRTSTPRRPATARR
jgi:Ca2+:H+ antiporter